MTSATSFFTGSEEQVVVKVVLDDSQFSKSADRVERTMRKKLNNGMTEVTKQVKNSNGEWETLSSTVEKTREEFNMAALSFIFAGMQIKNVSQQIAKVSVATFMKISQGQTEAGRSIIGLAANFKFLQFEIGNAIGTALKPLLPILTAMIRGVAQLVQQNPGATFAAIAAAFTLGTGLFLGGQMALFAQAVVSLVGKTGGLAGIASSVVSLGPLLPVILALTALAGVSWKAFSETPEAWESVKDAFGSLTGSDGAVSQLAGSLEDLIKTVLPEFKLSWENIGWTIAWVFNGIIDVAKPAIGILTLLIQLATMGINSIVGIYAAIRGDEKEAIKRQQAVQAGRSSIDRTRASLQDNLSNIGQTFGLNPMEFKAQQEASQARSSGVGGAFTDTQGQTIINANVVNYTPANDAAITGASMGLIRRAT